MLFVREYGQSGPVVIALHGDPGAPGSMAPVARRLASHFRVLEPFQRSAGTIPLTVGRHVEDLHEVVLGCCGDARPALIGSSWGAMLALIYAATHPEWAGPLVLVGCPTFDPESKRTMQQTVSERAGVKIGSEVDPGALPARDDEPSEPSQPSADRIDPVYVYDPASNVGSKDRREDRIDARAQRETLDDMLRLQKDHVYPHAFVRIDGPAVMVHGDYDPHPGRMIHSSLKRYLPQLEYIELERCGHFPWHERGAAEEFFTVLHGWLSDTCATKRA